MEQKRISMDLKKISGMFYQIGQKLKNWDPKLVESFIIDLRAERTPGRFFEKLIIRIIDYNKKIEGFNETIPREIIETKVTGDKFYYLKAAILTGLINSLTINIKKNE